MKKSTEIIKTTGELLEHYTPQLIGLVVMALAVIVFAAALKEIKDLELETTEGALLLLFALPWLNWSLGTWAGENKAKLKEDETDETE